MHFWFICITLLWTNEVRGYGEQSIRIGKAIITILSLIVSFSHFPFHSSLFHSQIGAGLITDDPTDRIQRTFEHAISVVNSDLSIPLMGETEKVAYGNSLQALAQLCSLMQVGK